MLSFVIFLTLTNERSVFQKFVNAFFVVALVEEFSKYLIVRVYAQKSKEFNEPFDGIVYAVLVSMGFAALEKCFICVSVWRSNRYCKGFFSSAGSCSFCYFNGVFYGES